MKILVLGGDGMLGHRLLAEWSGRHDVRVTLRRPLEDYRALGLFSGANAVGGVDARDVPRITSVIEAGSPDVVVNAIGLVKQRPDASDAVPAIEINALLPHRLADICRRVGARLVHISTDCVFSGRVGGYRETDLPDPVDLYGRSKLLGEVVEGRALTLRTSLIGLELSRRLELVEWFLAQRGRVSGYTRAIFSGFTTQAFAGLIGRVIEAHADLSGLWHVAAAPISKHDLLQRLARALGRTDVDIVPDDRVVCDRSLRADRFLAATGYEVPSWDRMVADLAGEIRRRDEAGAAHVGEPARSES